MKTRVQFIICDRVKDFYGITSGLFNSASFVVKFLNEDENYEAILSPVVDSNAIDRAVSSFDPDIVIIEALWVPPAKFKELLKIKRHEKRRWIVRIHSKAPFLANEGLATKWIHAYTEVPNPGIEIAPNTLELTQQLHSAFPDGKFLFLPNVYYSRQFNPGTYGRNKDWVDVGCFGAIRPMKNNYQQALAAIEFAESIDKRLRFHVNSTRTEQSGDNALRNIRALFDNSPHELVEHHWYKHKQFLKIISKMDIGMQVSFSESFNIVSADFVTAKVPIVVSDDIEWLPGFLKTTPTSHRGMVKKLKRGYKWRKFSAIVQKIYLKIYNFKAEVTWLAAIRKDK
jgi:hypothetical protein